MPPLAWPAPIAPADSVRPTDREHWSAAWSALGVAQAPAEAYEQLLARYAEPHRAYHTRQHLDECLRLLAAARGLCAHPDEVALALWFHDAIYEPTRANNEAQSAEWLARLAAAASVPSATIERLQALVMSTCHTSEPRDPDARVLVDIDLAILGAPRQRFDAYERQIRREYRWVPAPIYRRKRARALERFVARPAIYATGPFRAHFEQRARENIGRSIALLGQRT